jgi:hypothetical protein
MQPFYRGSNHMVSVSNPVAGVSISATVPVEPQYFQTLDGISGSIQIIGQQSFSAADKQNVVGVATTYYGEAIALLKSGGSVIASGNPSDGGLIPSVSLSALSSGVVKIASTRRAFAALKSDGSVVAWGNESFGGSLPNGIAASGVVAIASNLAAFAALKSDGSVVVWGDVEYGGSYSGVVQEQLASGVVSITSTQSAFAALKSNGSVVVWGDEFKGGVAPASVSSGVTRIVANYFSFSAFKSNGSIVTWGDSENGGSAPSSVSSGVVALATNLYAYAAIKSDGTVVAWGNAEYGGTVAPQASSGVVAIASTYRAFAAVKDDGSVVTWGQADDGGVIPSEKVTALSSGVSRIASTAYAFAALKTDGSVVVWGGSASGGSIPESIASQLTSGVINIQSTLESFSAVKSDGSVVIWGIYADGASAPIVQANVTRNYGVGYSYISYGGPLPIIDTTPIQLTPPPSNVPCIPAGQRVLTQRGLVAVEELKEGTDKVVTEDGRKVPFKRLSTTVACATEKNAPVRIVQGSATVELSPDHMIQLCAGVWARPSDLVASGRAKQVRVGEPVTYYHIALPNYLRDNLVVEGFVTESFGGLWAKLTKSRGSYYTWSEKAGGYVRSQPAAKAVARA